MCIKCDCLYGWAGPATVVCDYLTYVFMFLSIATSNMVATSLAKQVSFFSCHSVYITYTIELMHVWMQICLLMNQV